MRSRTLLELVLAASLVSGSIAFHGDATAQTALATMLVQSDAGLCLAVALPPRNPAVPSAVPALGWRVVVEPCSGARNQRFQQLYGDYDDFYFDAGLCLGQVAGSALVELAPCDTPRPVIESGGRGSGGQPTELRLGHGDLCLTAPAAGSGSQRVTLTTCDGRRAQRWTMSRAR